ncbi:MAG: cytochrome c [Cellvibrionaceae bacterium]|nr:cytochrome c [Cellvibrionaceae bacterium]
MKIIISVSCFMFLSISALVLAHGGATGVVKERMDLMENLKGAMKTLKPMMRGQQDYDVDTVKQNALIIRDNAGEHMTKLFPEGSLEEPSEAKPEIWTEWTEFQRIANNLKRLGQALHDGADNNPAIGPHGGMGGHGMMGNPRRFSR